MSDEIIELNRYIGELQEKIQQLMIYRDHCGIRSQAKEKLAKFGAMVFNKLLNEGVFCDITNDWILLRIEQAGLSISSEKSLHMQMQILTPGPGIKEAIEELTR